ncbi:MAG: hypothetical protein ACE5FN_00600 [Leptospirillia bacterium]
MFRIQSHKARSGLLFAALAALLTLLVSACGPGGDNVRSLATEISGSVKIPAASSQLGKTSLFARAGHWLFPEAMALTGMKTVAGEVVSLYAIDRNGVQQGPILAQAVTDANGKYTIRVPSWDLYNANFPRVVAVGSAANGTLMRRFVDDLTSASFSRDIDPATEAAVRIIINDTANPSLAEVKPSELAEFTDLVIAASDAVSGLTIEDIIDVAYQTARASESVQTKQVTMTSTLSNTRPLARAGIDFSVPTGSTLNLIGSAYDADGDLVSFQWRIVSTPAGSAITRTPAVGSRLVFVPDVDGTYLLELVVTDINLVTSPPDFATIIATTAPVLLTNDAAVASSDVESEGRMTDAKNLMIYTAATRDPSTNSNYADVYLQQISDAGWLGSPVLLYPPGANTPTHVETTAEIHPALAPNGVMAVFSTDLASAGVGGSDFEIVAVPTANPGGSIWVSDNIAHETQPDVHCSSGLQCTVVYVSDEDPSGDQIIAATLLGNGSTFAVSHRITLTSGAIDHFAPRISRDGQWVVYVAADAVEGDLEVFRIRTDGSMTTPQQLTDNSVNDDQPVPDTGAINVAVHREGAIYLVKGNGAPEVRLTPLSLLSNHPSISSDGQKIAFVGETEIGSDLFSVSADGFNLVQLTDDGSVSQPQISADGNSIMFRSSIDGDHDFYLR